MANTRKPTGGYLSVSDRNVSRKASSYWSRLVAFETKAASFGLAALVAANAGNEALAYRMAAKAAHYARKASALRLAA